VDMSTEATIGTCGRVFCNWMPLDSVSILLRELFRYTRSLLILFPESQATRRVHYVFFTNQDRDHEGLMSGESKREEEGKHWEGNGKND